ncbi:MAG: restriction endonuclease, partial [Alphaproteobacteria bacterium]
SKGEAEERSKEAQAMLDSIRNILSHTLSINDAIDWDTLKQRGSFPERSPAEPNEQDFKPKLGTLDFLLPFLKKKKLQKALSAYSGAKASWRIARDDWSARREKFEAERKSTNDAIDHQRVRYLAKDSGAIEEYCDLVLSRSEYPDFCPKEFSVVYIPETKTVGVDYELPSLDQLPRLNEVKFIATRQEFKESELKEADAKRLYDSALYQICLRTIHELFEADTIKAIGGVAFNGWVTAINRGTGRESRGCVMSVVAERSAFEAINLRAVDPKTCFRTLKGAAASELAGMMPIPPIVQFNKEDPRFVESVEVADGLSEGQNIAAIGWEDFEHLIRELFERELKGDSAEVKITRASHDEGVDAVAFDPDPIRGGKIIIQAKRYSNTVGVAAVRDLYGTIVNEGATKGILVTTSTFGPESYRFAQDKPIVLMDGSNLLHLLAKHGVNARIDLAEAKKLDVGLKRSGIG